MNIRLKKLWTKIALVIIITSAVLSPIGIIFQSTGFIFQKNTANAQQKNTATIANNIALPTCINLTTFDPTACLAYLVYYGAWYPTHWLVAGAATIQDYFIFFSIQSPSYRGAFVEKGWLFVRDVSNLIFIFALLFIAISLILGTSVPGGGSPKKLLGTLLIAAVAINFSLFFSKVIIDAGNILARTIYAQINISDANTDPTGEIKSVGLAVMNFANPQRMIGQSVGQGVTPGTGNIRASGNDAVTFLLVSILATFFNVALISLFVKMTWYFIGRTIGLFFSMIISPFAIASLAFPFLAQKAQRLNYNGWIKELLSLSFMAPLYLFFVFLTVQFLGLGIPILPPASQQDNIMSIFISVLVPLVLVYMLLTKGSEIAKEMSGEAGQMVAKAGKVAAGVALTAAAGGLAIGAARTIGAGANTAAKSKRVQNWATNGNRLQRAMAAGVKGAGKSSFDIRKTMLGNQVKAITGVDMDNKKMQFMGRGLTTAQTTGGYRQAASRKAAKKQKNLEKKLWTGDEAKARDAYAKAKNKKYEKHIDANTEYKKSRKAAQEKIRNSDPYKNAQQNRVEDINDLDKKAIYDRKGLEDLKAQYMAIDNSTKAQYEDDRNNIIAKKRTDKDLEAEKQRILSSGGGHKIARSQAKQDELIEKRIEELTQEELNKPQNNVTRKQGEMEEDFNTRKEAVKNRIKAEAETKVKAGYANSDEVKFETTAMTAQEEADFIKKQTAANLDDLENGSEVTQQEFEEHFKELSNVMPSALKDFYAAQDEFLANEKEALEKKAMAEFDENYFDNRHITDFNIDDKGNVTAKTVEDITDGKLAKERRERVLTSDELNQKTKEQFIVDEQRRDKKSYRRKAAAMFGKTSEDIVRSEARREVIAKTQKELSDAQKNHRTIVNRYETMAKDIFEKAFEVEDGVSLENVLNAISSDSSDEIRKSIEDKLKQSNSVDVLKNLNEGEFEAYVEALGDQYAEELSELEAVDASKITDPAKLLKHKKRKTKARMTSSRLKDIKKNKENLEKKMKKYSSTPTGSKKDSKSNDKKE